jgi:hypothetical protein
VVLVGCEVGCEVGCGFFDGGGLDEWSGLGFGVCFFDGLGDGELAGEDGAALTIGKRSGPPGLVVDFLGLWPLMMISSTTTITTTATAASGASSRLPSGAPSTGARWLVGGVGGVGGVGPDSLTAPRQPQLSRDQRSEAG